MNLVGSALLRPVGGSGMLQGRAPMDNCVGEGPCHATSCRQLVRGCVMQRHQVFSHGGVLA
jgi:hypothetical protein